MKLNEKVSYGAVAAAVALACGSIVADAATLGTTAVTTMSQQGNSLATATATQAFTITVTLGANYIQNDTAQLTFTGGSVPTTGAAPANAACSPSNAVFGALSYDTATNKANYRVTSGSPATGDVCTYNVALRTSTMTSGNVTASYAAQTASSALAFDAGTAALRIGTVADQFSSGVVTALNGEVDVNSGRYHFSASDGALAGLLGFNDQLTFSIGNASSSLSAGVAVAGVTSVVASINGDFSFLDDDGTAGCTSTDISAGRGVAVASSGSLSIAENCRTLTLSVPGGAAGEFTTGLVTLALGKNTTATAGNYRASTTTAGTVIEKVLFAPQSFAVGVAFTYYNTTTGATSTGSLGTTTSASGNAGAWTLNGATITVPFMSYTATGTSSLSRILYLTNRSAQSGAVSVSAINESGTACADFDVGTVQGNSVLNMGAAVDAGIRACYGASFDGKVALTITANIPGSSATVYSAYNRNGSIATVVNSSNQ